MQNQLLRLAAQKRLYPNPQAFLHFIPWDELTPVSSQCDMEHLSCHLPGSHNGTRWMLWTPPIEGFGCNHHLHVEDQLLEYSMERHWHFPGHEMHREVVFALTPLAESGLIPGLGAYWTEWVCKFRIVSRSHDLIRCLDLTLFVPFSASFSFLFARMTAQ